MGNSGWTTLAALDNSLDDVRSSARIIRGFEGRMSQLSDRQKLSEGTGEAWQEISYNRLTAQAITATTDLDNPQQIGDSLLKITPTKAGIETFILDTVGAKINRKGFAQIGKLGQLAMQDKKDKDGLVLLNSGATTSEPGAGAALTSSFVAHAKFNISSNTTEPGPGPFYCVLHGFGIADLYDELVAGIGTYAVGEGPTARVFSEGFTLPIAGVKVFEDGNITIDSAADAVGGVFSAQGIVFVQGMEPRIVPVRNEKRGGGGYHVYHYDEYAYGERPSGGGWIYRMKHDATTPA